MPSGACRPECRIASRAMLAFAGEEIGEVYILTPKEEAALAEAGAAGGEFATEEEVRAVWAKHGL